MLEDALDNICVFEPGDDIDAPRISLANVDADSEHADQCLSLFTTENFPVFHFCIDKTDGAIALFYEPPAPHIFQTILKRVKNLSGMFELFRNNSMA